VVSDVYFGDNARIAKQSRLDGILGVSVRARCVRRQRTILKARHGGQRVLESVFWERARVLGQSEHRPRRLLQLLDAFRAHVGVTHDVGLVNRSGPFNFAKALVGFLVEKALEVEDLPALLAREVVGQLLQLVQHHVLVVVVVEDTVEQEAVRALVALSVIHRVVEESLASCLRPEVNRLLAMAI